MEVHHWTPEQIGRLTFLQLRVLSGEDKLKGISRAEACEQIAEWRKQQGALQ